MTTKYSSSRVMAGFLLVGLFIRISKKKTSIRGSAFAPRDRFQRASSHTSFGWWLYNHHPCPELLTPLKVTDGMEGRRVVGQTKNQRHQWFDCSGSSPHTFQLDPHFVTLFATSSPECNALSSNPPVMILYFTEFVNPVSG